MQPRRRKKACVGVWSVHSNGPYNVLCDAPCEQKRDQEEAHYNHRDYRRNNTLNHSLEFRNQACHRIAQAALSALPCISYACSAASPPSKRSQETAPLPFALLVGTGSSKGF